MMTQYRFKLRPYRYGGKLSCPSCGRPKCFTPYIDTSGSITFPDDVGRCDHINSCGYHKTPKEYFAEHPIIEKNLQCISRRTALPTDIQRPISYIERSYLYNSLGHSELNPLYQFLVTRFDREAIEEVFRLYNVGTGKRWGGCTVYWQIDINGQIRTGKLMRYDRGTGHRIKDGAAITWAHSLLHIPNFNLRQCFFGEHLLSRYSDRKVMIVESEKSALIGAIHLPQFVWLASGGISGCFNIEASKALSQREVILIPDLGGEENWINKMIMLQPICRRVTMSRWLTNHATEEQRRQGLDIADYLIAAALKKSSFDPAGCTDQELFDHWKETIPGFRELADKLELECVTPHRRGS